MQYSFSFAKSKKLALDAAHEQWRSNLVPREKLADLRTPADFDRMTEHITRDEVAEKIPLITSMKELFDEVEKIRALPVNLISLHNVNRNHEEFIDAFSQYQRM
ncbi:MAG: hypothetical protein EOP49_48440 [Sphingobacteriales bacterium]|nr:MAG: hypothetical protein EOP49_48440 [Sphingobacteriales bacterium]